MPMELSQFTFTYMTIAKLTGLSYDAVRRHKGRGSFDPNDLGTVVMFVARHGTPEMRKAMLEAALLRELPKPVVKVKRKKAGN